MTLCPLQLTSPQSYTLQSLSAPNRVLSELNEQRLSATGMAAPIFATSAASMSLLSPRLAIPDDPPSPIAAVTSTGDANCNDQR